MGRAGQLGSSPKPHPGMPWMGPAPAAGSQEKRRRRLPEPGGCRDRQSPLRCRDGRASREHAEYAALSDSGTPSALAHGDDAGNPGSRSAGRQNMYDPLSFAAKSLDSHGTSAICSRWRIHAGISQSGTSVTAAERSGSAATAFISWAEATVPDAACDRPRPALRPSAASSTAAPARAAARLKPQTLDIYHT